MNQRKLGSDKEAVAAAYLKEKGYCIVEKNYRVRQGEIDLVAKDRDTLVFVEVKYRKNPASGFAAEAVGMAKQRKISRVSLSYLSEHGISPDAAIRYDVIAIDQDVITHYENAFLYCYL